LVFSTFLDMVERRIVMGNPTLTSEARKEKITRKAQELYEKRGRQPEHDLDDWLAAERMVDREIQEAAKGQTNTKR
jgi:hypothetical protein